MVPLLSEDAAISRKLKKAAQLLLYQHHRLPGVKGWEMKKILGKDYMKIVKLLERKLEDLGLEVKVVYADGLEHLQPSEDDLEQARFYVLSKSPIQTGEASLSGWRIDTLAVLAASLAFITSKQGKAQRREVEDMLREKFPDWKVDQDLNRFIRRGYLDEDETGTLFIGWRTRAEIDRKKLIGIIAGSLQDGQAQKPED